MTYSILPYYNILFSLLLKKTESDSATFPVSSCKSMCSEGWHRELGEDYSVYLVVRQINIQSSGCGGQEGPFCLPLVFSKVGHFPFTVFQS